jgi:EAL domain-containing protein (putative c-di-GMP-specific phosphodiesterase class I)/GGDEF domain-containing protein
MPEFAEVIPLPDTALAGGRLLGLARSAIDTAFQPIVETVSGEIYGFESLMRGHADLGFDTPLTLIDAFALGGELFALEQLTTSLALAKFSSLPDHGQRTLFLNLDSRTIAQGDAMLDTLMSRLLENRISPSSICFELSERFDNTILPDFAALTRRMRMLGFKLAIDDFGTGHAEMRLLSDFHLDYLKIDRHLISAIDATPKKRHLAKSVIDMAHVLGMRVIAEGVETESEFLVCRDLGADLVQGWFIARPDLRASEMKACYPHLRDLGEPRKNRRSLDETLIRQQVETLPTIHEHDTVESLFELFRLNPHQPFFPVLNSAGEPRGIIQEARIKHYIYQPYGRDLLRNKHYGRDISIFIDPAPVVSIDTDSSRLMAIFSGADEATCVILTEGMRYAGVVSAASLIKIINEKQIRQAQDQNPLTGMPGNQAILSYLQDMMHDGDTSRHLCYCDFDNFKPFNDYYGFQLGDQAITLFARLLNRYFFSSSVFLGHVGGDDFFVGVTGWTSDELEMVFDRLLGDFEGDMLKLYSRDDVERGYISGMDRAGQERRFDLIRCSVGILEIPAGRIMTDPLSISSRIASLKKHAKNDMRGLLIETLDEACDLAACC